MLNARLTDLVEISGDTDQGIDLELQENPVLETHLRQMDEAIGEPKAVEEFVTIALENLFGVQVMRDKKGYRIVMGNLLPQLRELLPDGDPLKISFISPTPQGDHYLGRNHRFVEQLCQMIMANTLARQGKRAARAAVIRTRQVAIKTALLLFRCRNVIEQGKSGMQIVAEEMLLWGWRGTPQLKEFLTHEEAKVMLSEARAFSDLSSQARTASWKMNSGSWTGCRRNSTPWQNNRVYVWWRRMNVSAPSWTRIVSRSPILFCPWTCSECIYYCRTATKRKPDYAAAD